MPQPRRPTALGIAPPKPPAAASPAERDDEEERTTVDDAPRRDRWEEQTAAERAARQKKAAGAPVREDSGEVLRDSVESIDEEMTVRADEPPVRGPDEPTVRAEDGVAEGTGDLGNSTVDEPTVEDSARPLPPLSVVPPIPQGKGRAPGAAVRKNPAVVGQLSCIAGNDTGRTFELTGKKVVIGRGVDCDLVLTDIAVSRRHVELYLDGKGYVLRDLGSGNGTLINDRIEDGACQLRDGDRLELGNTVIRFEHPASRVAPAVVGFGGQLDVDEEASTIAGNAPARTRKGAPLPAPHADRRLVLPPLPPGAQGSAEPGIHPSMAFAGSAYLRAPTPAAADPAVMVSLPGYDNVLLPVRRNLVLMGVIGAALLIVVVAIIATLLGDGEPQPTQAMVGPRPQASAAPVVQSASERPLLPASTWGTDERLLAARAAPPAPGVRPAVPGTAPAPAPTKVAPMAPPTQPAPVVAPPVQPPKAPPAVSPPKAAPPAKAAPPKTAPTPKLTARRPEPRPDPPRKAATAPARPKPAATSPARATAARKKAEGLYRSKQFATGALTLRTAAKDSDEPEASALRSLATDYEAVGTNLARAQQSQASSPTEAMGAYMRALGLDKSIGGGVHASFIRIKLGQVAPSAAASYMAQKRYEAAKKAADAAVNYGAGGDPTVRRVLGALERQAASMYQSASQQMKNDPEGAKRLLRRIIKMVPADSPTYASAYKLLNARKGAPRDEDE